MSQYICLDIGNVLVKANFQPFLRKLSKTLNISMEEANHFLNRTQKLHDLGYSRISDELADHFEIRSSVIIEELLQEWAGIVSEASYMLDFFNDLKKESGLKIALLSNIGLDHAGIIEKLLDHNGFLDDTVKYFSCFVGSRKPSSLYYQSFLQLHPDWKSCVYIDDLQENLDASKQFSFRTYRFALDEITEDNYQRTLEKMKTFIMSK